VTDEEQMRLLGEMLEEMEHRVMAVVQEYGLCAELDSIGNGKGGTLLTVCLRYVRLNSDQCGHFILLQSRLSSARSSQSVSRCNVAGGWHPWNARRRKIS
jgi:hypothetical protein